jgi:hypothetical protein
MRGGHPRARVPSLGIWRRPRLAVAGRPSGDRDEQSKTTGRETLLFFGPDGEVWSSKWRNVKAVFRWSPSIEGPIVKPQFPMVYDLGSDPSESVNLFAAKLDMGWMFGVAAAPVAEYEKTIAKYPNIKTGEEFTGYKAEPGS